ncbi:unnamed protein product, partial [Ceratitis capitata]
MAVEQQKCEQLYEEKTFRNHEGRHVVSSPFKAPPSGIDSGASRYIATRQFDRSESSLGEKPPLSKAKPKNARQMR